MSVRNHIFDSPGSDPMTTDSPKPPLKVMLCSPRGFCAGVVRAIDVARGAQFTDVSLSGREAP